MQYTVPGPAFCLGDEFWDQGDPSLHIFINKLSFLIFELLNQTPDDLAWLTLEPEEWMEQPTYVAVHNFVCKMEVTNDPAERAIKLLGERIRTVHTHERLLETIVTTEELRRLRENYRRKNTNKDLIQKVTDNMLQSSEQGKSWLQSESIISTEESDSDSRSGQSDISIVDIDSE